MMAADNYHRRIEGKFKKMQVKLNFRYIIDACRSAEKNCVTNTLRYDQLLAFSDDCSNSLIGRATTTISHISAAKFSRG